MNDSTGPPPSYEEVMKTSEMNNPQPILNQGKIFIHQSTCINLIL